jgi:hypothetical protein
MPHILNIETNERIEVAEFPVLRGGIWECGDQRFTDAQGTLYEAAPLPPVVPNSITRFQAKAALELAGLLGTVETIMADPATPILARLAWADALEFFRGSPTVAAIAAVLGLTDAQIDELFIVGSGISA